MAATLVGAHVGRETPLQDAAALGADCVQIFLSDPQSFRRPAPRADAEQLKASGMPIYVHAPYLINVCSPKNNVRHGARKILAQTCEAAGAIGAAGVVVHAGHAEDGIEEGVARWVSTLQRLRSPVPVLIENTAGGENAVARRFDALARLWDAVGGSGVGFCFDTCHAHAAGEELGDALERVLAIVGRIDLLHANDSRDAPGSGADRHANLGSGQIDPDALRAMIRGAGAPVIVETPGGADAMRADLAYVRAALA